MSFGPRPQHRLVGTCWRHVKTGRRYEIVRIALMEETSELVVVYEDTANHVWVRPYEKFMDGRFQQLENPFASRENPCCEIPL